MRGAYFFRIITAKLCIQKTAKINQNCVNWQKFAIVWSKNLQKRGGNRVFLRAPLRNVAVFRVCAGGARKLHVFKLKMLSESKTKRRPLLELTAYSWKYLGRTCVSASCLATSMHAASVTQYLAWPVLTMSQRYDVSALHQRQAM